jgi:branched-chain amino acid transport system ATP-binding protein
MSEDQLETKALDARYGPILAVEGVGIRVRRGEVVAILGANGVGKSTLLKAICGLVKVTRGTVHCDGQDITNRPTHLILRQGIALVPEGRRIVGTLTVEGNIRVAFGTTARRHRRRWSETVDEIYSLFPRLAERRGQVGGSLSGGEQQMLAIARALATAPAYLLLDEPSMGLAPKVTDQIYDALSPNGPILRGRGVLLAEQSASLALGVASYAVVLAKGKIELEGPKEKVSQANILAAYLGL